ncbi:NUDIX hydrolase [Alkaliphilus peptidifermentans]|uniref:8-oxo-dGTP diphosphatase n=1 Tax=Alkaliphilus peptidifermentans DSM 18978 TaxID=1120976 RepID=A0A1G5KJS9_9FIRM|nr:NUDIX domain-containing protein [Alkaliphilus peptidifermentans]SCZ00826.1 8-oxo-dGTP diphosphatase [Alkaliphilus peptidifermentans DSM 18978]
MEIFATPGAAGIIEKNENGIDYILIQERVKENAPLENGLLEIPAGKIREFENIYNCLRREILEETGLNVLQIEGEDQSTIFEENGYRVLNYKPFASAQNIAGNYPIIVQAFICKVEGEIIMKTNETRNIRWVSLKDLGNLITNDSKKIYPMHIDTLKCYLKFKGFSW